MELRTALEELLADYKHLWEALETDDDLLDFEDKPAVVQARAALSALEPREGPTCVDCGQPANERIVGDDRALIAYVCESHGFAARAPSASVPREVEPNE